MQKSAVEMHVVPLRIDISHERRFLVSTQVFGQCLNTVCSQYSEICSIHAWSVALMSSRLSQLFNTTTNTSNQTQLVTTHDLSFMRNSRCSRLRRHFFLCAECLVDGRRVSASSASTDGGARTGTLLIWKNMIAKCDRRQRRTFHAIQFRFVRG
jgi:hypothetical protein